MPDRLLLCRIATPFAPNGNFDEDAFRLFLQRFIDAKIGVYLASGGSGEGHALTKGEIGRLYRIAVDMCHGKVQANANPPEQNTVRETIEQARLGIDAGVDLVNLYGPAGAHGFRPTDAEFTAYLDAVLAEIKYPVALAPNAILGYMPSPTLIANLCRKYRQVETLNCVGLKDDNYFIELKSLLDRDIPINVSYRPETTNLLSLGAQGLFSIEANIVPKSYRRYLDAYENHRMDDLSSIDAELKRFQGFTRKQASGPRWIKMAMKILKLPGGAGGLRSPYLMPPAEEISKFAEGLLNLDVEEVDQMARLSN